MFVLIQGAALYRGTKIGDPNLESYPDVRLRLPSLVFRVVGGDRLKPPNPTKPWNPYVP